MTTNSWKFGTLLPAILIGSAILATGCAESTTEKDVGAARENLREEQRETAETVRDAQRDVADARHDAQPYTVNRPVNDQAAAEARQEIADAQHEAQQKIRDQKQDEREAAVELKTTEQQLAATKARDTFVADTEKQLAEVEARIDQLKSTASSAEGNAKQDLDRQIDALQNQHDRAEEALGHLKSAALTEWPAHRQNVRTAMQELDNSIKNFR